MKLHVEHTGAGPDLVLLHGWGLHSGVWADVTPALAKRFRVHAIDLPGHGYSQAVALPEFDDAAALVAAHIPPHALVCGWSLGGLLAQHIASDEGGPIGALALASSTPCFVQRAGWPHAMKAATLEAFALGLRTDAAATLENFVRLNALHGSHAREAIRTFTRRLLERGTPSASSLESGLRWLRDIDLRAATPAIKQRAVVIHGVRDALAPVEAGRWLAAHLPHATRVELADAAHLPFFSHPREFALALESLVG